jgi:desulfoferrodoxin (superoxide reductase-like protein)
MWKKLSQRIRASGGEQAVVSRRGILGLFGGAALLSACEVGAGSENVSEWQIRADDLKGPEVYTKAKPGIWAGKEGTHVPSIVREGDLITVSCTHGVDPEGKHWVTTVFVEDQDNNVIHLREFMGRGPIASSALTTFRIPPGTTSITAFAYCNLHDCWKSEPFSIS